MKRIWVWTKEKRIYYYDLKFHVLPQKTKISVNPDDLQEKVITDDMSDDSKDAKMSESLEAKEEVTEDVKAEEPKAEKKPKSPEPKSTASDSPIPEAISEPEAISDEPESIKPDNGEKDDAHPTTGTDADATEAAEVENGDGVVEGDGAVEGAKAGKEEVVPMKDTETPVAENDGVEKSDDEVVEKHEIISDGMLEIEITEV